MLSSVLFTELAANDQDAGDMMKNIETPVSIAEPKEFSHAFQLRQASNNVINSSIQMLSNTVQTIQTTYSELSQSLDAAIEVLTIALEINSLVLGVGTIDEELLRIRNDIATQKSQITGVLFIYEDTRALLNSSISVAYLVGNEVGANLASGYAYNSEREVSPFIIHESNSVI